MAEKKVDQKSFKDVGIISEGTQIILPLGMEIPTAITWLERKREEDEQLIRIYEACDALPLEGAFAFQKALERIFGFTATKPAGFFDAPPTWVALKVSPTETVQVFWGTVLVPGLEKAQLTTEVEVANGKLRFVISGRAKKKDKAKLKELFTATREIIASESIYKGKAIVASFPNIKDEDFNPILFQHDFLDTAKIDPKQLIFPKSVQQMVEDTLFTPLRHTSACRAANIPLKRGILLEGPFGVGKTLTQYVTAKYAVDNGWTYIQTNDTAKLAEAMQMAKHFQPAVVVAEDIDRADQEGARTDAMNIILNTLDGTEFKGAEMIVVLTTNHVERLTPAMLRPGRLDAVIPVRPPDAEAVERLVRLYAGELLARSEDLSEVGKKLAGHIPAVVREVVERSKLSAINRLSGEERLQIVAEDLVRAATSMLEHLELLKTKQKDLRSNEEKAADVLGRHIFNAATLGVDATVAELEETLQGLD